MFRTLKYNPTRWLLGLLVLLGVQSREICAPTDAQAVDVSTVRCSMRVAKGIKNFTTAVAGAAAACTVDDLKDEDESFVCLEHEDFLKESADAASSLYREVSFCASHQVLGWLKVKWLVGVWVHTAEVVSEELAEGFECSIFCVRIYPSEPSWKASSD